MNNSSISEVWITKKLVKLLYVACTCIEFMKITGTKWIQALPFHPIALDMQQHVFLVSALWIVLQVNCPTYMHTYMNTHVHTYP